MGSDCNFCAWRKDNPIELGWERLLETPESENGASTLCGVDLTCSQVENPYRELSTQQTADFFLLILMAIVISLTWTPILNKFSSQYDSTCPSVCPLKSSATKSPSVSTVPTASQADGNYYFPSMDSDFEQILSQYDSTCPCVCQLSSSATELPSVSTVPRASQASCVSTPAAASTSTRIYTSPKGNEAVKAARASSIPVKTKHQTVRLWADWAIARNKNLLAGEKPFILFRLIFYLGCNLDVILDFITVILCTHLCTTPVTVVVGELVNVIVEFYQMWAVGCTVNDIH